MKFALLFLILSSELCAKGIEDSTTYHSNSTLQWNAAMETIELVPLTGSEYVLDVGCGDGKITAFLANKLINGNIIGVDISERMINFASSHYFHANLQFKQHDATELPFDNQFDCIVSFSTLHWVIDQQKALKAFYRALIPGGKVCIHTYGKGRMNVTCIADSLIHTEKWSAYFPSYTKQRAFFTEEEYYALLERAGFEQIKVFGSWSETLYPNRELFVAFARPLLIFINHLSPELQDEFVGEVVDKIILIAGQSDEGIRYQTFNLRAIATK